MLLAIRHARTDFNENGSERLRGWLPVPLSAEGERESQQTAEHLGRLHLPIRTLQSSPMRRAQQTAHTIGAHLHLAVHPTSRLSDWNIGHLAGQSADRTLPIVHHFVGHPQAAPPGGEPYGAFAARTAPLLHRLIAEPGLHAIVTHNRVLTLLHAMVHHAPRLLKERGPVEPGGAVLVTHPHQMHILFGAPSPEHRLPSRV